MEGKENQEREKMFPPLGFNLTIICKIQCWNIGKKYGSCSAGKIKLVK